MYENTITHEGIIEQITDEDLSVRLTRLPACGECHAKSLCSVPGADNSKMVIPGRHSGFSLGDRVYVSMAQSQGFKALLVGYFVPFIVVAITLTALSILQVQELVAGLISLATLIPYFFLIKIFRKKIESTLTFKVIKAGVQTS